MIRILIVSLLFVFSILLLPQLSHFFSHRPVAYSSLLNSSVRGSAVLLSDQEVTLNFEQQEALLRFLDSLKATATWSGPVIERAVIYPFQSEKLTLEWGNGLVRVEGVGVFSIQNEDPILTLLQEAK